jgi:hypothetical protein
MQPHFRHSKRRIEARLARRTVFVKPQIPQQIERD